MTEPSIRDVFLSMQLPPVDEIVANSRTDFRTIRKSRRSCYRPYHAPQHGEVTDTRIQLIDELIDTIRTKNGRLQAHLREENRAIDDLLGKKRDIDLWRQLTDLIIYPSTRKKSIDDQVIAYDLKEKRMVEFRKDHNENAPMKAWAYIGRHISDELVQQMLREPAKKESDGRGSTNTVKKVRRTNDGAHKLAANNGKTTTTNITGQSKAKRATRQSRM